MLDAMKSLAKGNTDEVKNSLLYPLVRWSSSSKSTLHSIQDINFYFYWIPQDFTKLMLSKVRQVQPSFMRYPKSTKYDNKKYDIIAEILKHKHNWSKRELSEQKGLIISLLDDTNAIKQLGTDYGLQKKEMKILGFKLEKIKKPKVLSPNSKSLFDF